MKVEIVVVVVVVVKKKDQFCLNCYVTWLLNNIEFYQFYHKLKKYYLQITKIWVKKRVFLF